MWEITVWNVSLLCCTDRHVGRNIVLYRPPCLKKYCAVQTAMSEEILCCTDRHVWRNIVLYRPPCLKKSVFSSSTTSEAWLELIGARTCHKYHGETYTEKAVFHQPKVWAKTKNYLIESWHQPKVWAWNKKLSDS